MRLVSPKVSLTLLLGKQASWLICVHFLLIISYGPTVGNAISGHPAIDKVAFTGSTAVGRKVMEEASKSNIKKVTLELGGKSANIVFEDADFEEAIKYSAQGIFFNHGQTCVSSFCFG